tara:strand:- start:12361 stop:12591 length:231 start_codon:yes stop_codon:yes gene_type:complete
MDMKGQNLIATYRHATKEEICQWLQTHMPVARMNQYENAGVDEQGRYRWRMSLTPEDTRVWFDREGDFMHFCIVWS